MRLLGRAVLAKNSGAFNNNVSCYVITHKRQEKAFSEWLDNEC